MPIPHQDAGHEMADQKLGGSDIPGVGREVGLVGGLVSQRPEEQEQCPDGQCPQP